MSYNVCFCWGYEKGVATLGGFDAKQSALSSEDVVLSNFYCGIGLVSVFFFFFPLPVLTRMRFVGPVYRCYQCVVFCMVEGAQYCLPNTGSGACGYQGPHISRTNMTQRQGRLWEVRNMFETFLPCSGLHLGISCRD